MLNSLARHIILIICLQFLLWLHRNNFYFAEMHICEETSDESAENCMLPTIIEVSGNICEDLLPTVSRARLEATYTQKIFPGDVRMN